MTTGKTIALTIWIFVSEVMSLLFNMWSRFVIAFLPRSKYFLISWLQLLSAVILEPQNIKCHCFYFFPSFCHEVMRPDAINLTFLMLSFKPAFSLSFTFIKRLLVLLHFLPQGWCHLHIIVFLLTILIPACDSSSSVFHTMHSAYKLNKQGDNIQP